ncbi:SGNH/GDSL hydrolase family protein [Nannocystis pusilla]|uniref:SGNH/GDSL hydrolase family protein n=1 Tax=Nannocystis pusilla TaxID=889268 RepID=UPI003DA53DDD
MPLLRLFVPLTLVFALACDKATPATPALTPPPAAIPSDEPPAAEPAPAAAAAPREPAIAPATPEPAPVEVAAAPSGPRKVLVLGDSLAATGFGAMLEKKLDEHPDIECFRKAKSATGLARPDFYDWESEAKKAVEQRKPDLVVVIMGGNDGQDLTTKTGKGKRVAWKSDGWNDAYKARVAEFLSEISAEGRKVLWLGLPRTGTTSFEQKLTTIRDVQSQALADFGEAGVYLDTTPFITDADGDLIDTATVGKRKAQALREEDGIHFTMAGSEFFADKVYPEVLRVLGVEDAAEGKKPQK